MSARRAVGVYVHIPVCKNKCGYCDFYSLPKSRSDNEFWSALFHSYKEEFFYKLALLPENWFLYSIHYGGGSPSLAPPHFFRELNNVILKNFKRAHKSPEITVEVNPEDVSSNLINQLIESGTTRLSMGIQSLSNADLVYLDRGADRESCIRALDTIESSGFDNLNVDLMYGLPGQKIKTLESTLNALMKYNLSHISAYTLTICDNTPLQKLIAAGKKAEPSSRRDFMHYDFIKNFLEQRGFVQYEVSNYAKPGRKSRHNSLYWKFRPYVGLGPGAHSFIPPKRIRNISDLDLYITSTAKDYEQHEDCEAWPELFIGTFRLPGRHGDALYKRSLSQKELGSFENLKQFFYNEHWMKPVKAGFLITPSGLLYSDFMLNKCMNFNTRPH